jgi:hypothetical protein
MPETVGLAVDRRRQRRSPGPSTTIIPRLVAAANHALPPPPRSDGLVDGGADGSARLSFTPIHIVPPRVCAWAANATVAASGFPSSALTISDRLRHRGNGHRHSIEPTIMDAHEIASPMAVTWFARG